MVFSGNSPIFSSEAYHSLSLPARGAFLQFLIEVERRSVGYDLQPIVFSWQSSSVACTRETWRRYREELIRIGFIERSKGGLFKLCSNWIQFKPSTATVERAERLQRDKQRRRDTTVAYRTRQAQGGLEGLQSAS